MSHQTLSQQTSQNDEHEEGEVISHEVLTRDFLQTIQEEDLTTSKIDMQGEKIDVLTSTPMGHNTSEAVGQEDGQHTNHMSRRQEEDNYNLSLTQPRNNQQIVPTIHLLTNNTGYDLAVDERVEGGFRTTYHSSAKGVTKYRQEDKPMPWQFDNGILTPQLPTQAVPIRMMDHQQATEQQKLQKQKDLQTADQARETTETDKHEYHHKKTIKSRLGPTWRIDVNTPLHISPKARHYKEAQVVIDSIARRMFVKPQASETYMFSIMLEAKNEHSQYGILLKNIAIHLLNCRSVDDIVTFDTMDICNTINRYLVSTPEKLAFFEMISQSPFRTGLWADAKYNDIVKQASREEQMDDEVDSVASSNGGREYNKRTRPTLNWYQADQRRAHEQRNSPIRERPWHKRQNQYRGKPRHRNYNQTFEEEYYKQHRMPNY